MWSLREPPLFTTLAPAQRVLIAGAGGGFDVYAGLPLALALRAAGQEVHLANLTFSSLDWLDLADWVGPGVAAIGTDTSGSEQYFPERTLARWCARQGWDTRVYALDRNGVKPLRAAYSLLVDKLGIDAIVLVDGGTDILMRGDEDGIGTPAEDMASLAAVAGLPGVPVKVVVSLGLGIDAYHGVCSAHVLENVAALERAGAYLGALSIPRLSAEGAAYLDAVADAQAATPARPSIVHGQIEAAIRGEYGDIQFTRRTAGSELYVNPLMGVYFSFDLMGISRHLHYRAKIEPTVTPLQIGVAIESYRYDLTLRRHRAIPH